MTQNEHNYDRIIRIILAIGLFVAAVAANLWWLAIPGVILLATAVIGFCPIYAILGMSTRRKQSPES